MKDLPAKKEGSIRQVYGYLRVSTDRQDTAAQKLGVEKKAAELGVNIDEWIRDDGISGIKEASERNLGLLIEAAQEGDIIIVSEISRLARSVFMLFRIVEELVQKKGVEIYTVKENQIFRKNDVVSAILLSAYGTAAQIEREMIIKRTNEGLANARARGVIFGPRIGYKKELKLAKHHSKILAYIDKGYSNGKIARMLCCAKITLLDYFARMGIKSKKTKYENYRRTKNYISFIAGQNTMDQNRACVLKLIEKGIRSPKKIYASLIEKGLDVSRSAVLRWFALNPDVYAIAIEKDKTLRAKYNPIANNYKESNLNYKGSKLMARKLIKRKRASHESKQAV